MPKRYRHVAEMVLDGIKTTFYDSPTLDLLSLPQSWGFTYKQETQ